MTDRENLLFQHLAQFVSDHKKDVVERVLRERTRYVAVVLENIYQSQNASAAIRTCECMGVQDVYVVENTAEYHLNVRVLKGADKWLNLERFKTRGVNNTENCFNDLRTKGYKILVADPAADGIPIADVNVAESRVAIVFGNELNGASAYALEHADQKIKIPMYGFTESLNISVSVAMCLNTVLVKLRESQLPIFLSDEEKRILKLAWYRKIVKRSQILEREFYAQFRNFTEDK